MIKEKCSKCHNIVIGEFSPTDTRKWLTTLAKKGGMKAVLTAAGSVIPGFGNAMGLIAGTAIDVIYGKDINKLVDDVADLFDDNKVYVFTCPNCGHSWTKRVDDDYDDDDASTATNYSSSSSTSASYTSGSSTSTSSYKNIDWNEKFRNELDSYLEKIGAAVDDPYSSEKQGNEFKDMGYICELTEPVVASQYFFLAGLCDLIYAKDHHGEEVTKSSLNRSKRYFSKAVSLLDDDEYKLMLRATDLLLCKSPKRLSVETVIDTRYYKFNNGTLLNADWLKSLYDSCFVLAFSDASDMIDQAEEGTYDRATKEDLWKLGLGLSRSDIRMYSALRLFLLHDYDETSSGKMTVKASRYLNEAYEAEGFSLSSVDVNNFFDNQWLTASVFYAESIVENENALKPKDIPGGLEILYSIAALDDCGAKRLACETLGGYFEDGNYVKQDLAEALKFYDLGRCEEEIERLKQEMATSHSSSPVNLDNETEYLEELKACLEDGEISKGERRLLEKLRVKLGISESRAAELEESLLKPQLTEAEQEYLDEYHECLADGGSITAGERRLLNRLSQKLGISPERAAQLENM